MVRHDYQLLTDVLTEVRLLAITARDKVDATECVEAVAHSIGNALAQDNKAFDKDKFINAIRGQVLEGNR